MNQCTCVANCHVQLRQKKVKKKSPLGGNWRDAFICLLLESLRIMDFTMISHSDIIHNFIASQKHGMPVGLAVLKISSPPCKMNFLTKSSPNIIL